MSADGIVGGCFWGVREALAGGSCVDNSLLRMEVAMALVSPHLAASRGLTRAMATHHGPRESPSRGITSLITVSACVHSGVSTSFLQLIHGNIQAYDEKGCVCVDDLF